MITCNGYIQLELIKKKPLKNNEGTIVNEGAVEEYAKVINVRDWNDIKKGDTVYFMSFSVYRLMDEKGKELAFVEGNKIMGVE